MTTTQGKVPGSKPWADMTNDELLNEMAGHIADDWPLDSDDLRVLRDRFLALQTQNELLGGEVNWQKLVDAIDALPDTERRDEMFERIGAELDRAYAKHGREQWSRHEFYGIIAEEFDEMWNDIKRDAPQDVLEKEIIQVAAMCFRYFETRDRYREPAACAPLVQPAVTHDDDCCGDDHCDGQCDCGDRVLSKAEIAALGAPLVHGSGQ